MFKPAAPLSCLLRALLPVIFVASGLLSAARADETQQPHELSDKTSDTLQQVQKLTDPSVKNYDGAIAAIDTAIAGTAPTSYDHAVLVATKAQIYFQKSDYMGAIESLEDALSLGETYNYFDKKVIQQYRYYLATLYEEKATESKNPDVQNAYYDKARGFLERWFAVHKEMGSPTYGSTEFTNAEYVYAALLFNIATQRDPKNVDHALVQKALDAVNTGLRSTLHPSDNFYVLELAADQDLGHYADAADILEHLLQAKPDNKTYWQQLSAFYLNLAGTAEEKQNDEAAHQYYIRAILSIERAQQHGAMNSPKDNFRLVTIYYNVGQYEQAAELLEAGLDNGNIDSTPDNWKLLAICYQQLHKDLKAVDVLRKASDRYPKMGQFDYLAAQILYSLNDTAGALKAIQSCVSRDGGDSPWEAWRLLTYLAIELQKFDIASDAVKHLANYSQIKPSEAKNLAEAVKAAIAERDATVQRANH